MNRQKLTKVSQRSIFNEVEEIFESSENAEVAFVNTNVDESEHEQNSQNVGVDDSENLENENDWEHDSQYE